MKRIRIKKATNAQTLHDELLDAIPALRPVETPGSIFPTARLLLETDGDDVTVYVPEEVDDLTVTEVVETHIPFPPQHAPSPKQRAVEAIENASNMAQVKAALVEYLNESQ